MGKSDEFIVVNGIFTETSNRYTHSVFVVDILAYLRTVVFFQILDEMFRCTRKFQFLRKSPEIPKCFDQLFFCRFLTEFNEYCSCMSVQYRNTKTLTGDNRLAGTITPSSILPHSLNGSFSLFSSSPPIYGMILCSISGQSLNVFPAPEIA